MDNLNSIYEQMKSMLKQKIVEFTGGKNEFFICGAWRGDRGNGKICNKSYP